MNLKAIGFAVLGGQKSPSIGFTRQGSLVRTQHRPPPNPGRQATKKPMIFMGFFVFRLGDPEGPRPPGGRLDRHLCPFCARFVPRP